MNTLGEQRDLLACVDWMHSSIWSSEAQIQGLQSHISLRAAELEAWQSEVGRLEASAQVVNRQLSASQVAFITGESERDQSWALVDAEAQKIQDLKRTLAEVLRRLNDHLSIFHSSHNRFCCDVNRALNAYLRPLFDAMCE